jgi:hypothetical protein
MSYISSALKKLVVDRANGRCEYCLLPNLVTYYPHEVDHIQAEKHEGETVAENLCLSCSQCNRHKGSDLASIDKVTGDIVLLFNPRKDQWNEHFQLRDAYIEGTTPKGRATARLLHFNDDEQMNLREELIKLGIYP